MRFSFLISLLIIGLTAVNAVALLPQEDCFSGGQVTCRQSGTTLYADKDKALAAITTACEAMKCTVGTTPSPNTVTGKVPGYTATLRVGDKCAGLNPWSTEACVNLYQTYLYPQCKTNDSLPYPNYPPTPFPPVEPNMFPLASVRSNCGESGDASSLGFNIGG